MAVAGTAPGTHASMEVLRKGAPKKLDITVAALTDEKVAAAQSAPTADQGRLGLAVRPLEPQERQQAGIKGGVRVEAVSGPAAKAGIRPGDLILSLNNTPITSAEQLKSLVPAAGKHVALLVQREDRKIYVPLNLG
jgi:serine protease Do